MKRAVTLAALRARKVAAAARSGAARSALVRYRVVPAIEQRHLADLAPRTVIDVGANKGQFVLVLADLLPAATFVAIEPVPAAFEVLSRVVEPFRGRVALHHVAVGRTSGTIDLYVAADDDNSSVLPPGDAQLELAPAARTAEVIEVPLARLDDLVADADLADPWLLKIDVQGSEHEVLAGAGRVLARAAAVYVEVSFTELYVGNAAFTGVAKTLEDAGLTMAGLYNPTELNGTIVQADALFVRGRG